MNNVIYDKKRTGFNKIYFLLAMMMFALIGFGAISFAEETQELKQGTLVTVLQDADMHEKPDATSKVLFSFRAGDSVFQTGEAQNGWCPVMYHMVNGYIWVSGDAIPTNTISENSSLGEAKADESENAVLKVYADEKAVEEMAILEDQMNNFGTDVELDRKNRRESRIWGAIIVLLILAFVGSSILPTIKEQKKLKEQKDEVDKDVT